MTKEQGYFLKLIKSHLNSDTPEAPTEINLAELFKTCELQNMTAIAAIELKKLLTDNKIARSDFSPFNQCLGLTLQNYEYKLKGIDLLSDTLNKNNIRFMFVKGAAIRPLYPVAELRTSGDTDVIIDAENLETVCRLLTEQGFRLIRNTGEECDMSYCGEEYEIKSHIDYYNDKCREIFCNVFDDSCSTRKNDCEYRLKPLYHLTYITYHLLIHFKAGGAGIRQLTDIDVILRNENIDLNEFFDLCEQIGIKKSASVLVSLARRYFDTPVDFDYPIGEELLSMLENVMLNGGTFGYGIGNVGTKRLMRAINKSESNSTISSFKAVLGLFIISKDSLYKYYGFARKHHVLLPAAYFARIFEAVFKRGRQNAGNIKSMFTDTQIATLMSDMLKELDIK